MPTALAERPVHPSEPEPFMDNYTEKPGYKVLATFVPPHPDTLQGLYRELKKITQNPVIISSASCLEGQPPLGQRTTLEIIVSSSADVLTVGEVVKRYSGIRPPYIQSQGVKQV